MCVTEYVNTSNMIYNESKLNHLIQINTISEDKDKVSTCPLCRLCMQQSHRIKDSISVLSYEIKRDIYFHSLME